MQSIQVVPEKLIDPNHRAYQPGLSSYASGGKYLFEGLDVTGWSMAHGWIGCGIGGLDPVLKFDGIIEPAERSRDSTICRINLFKKSAGWEWEQDECENDIDGSSVKTLVSVEWKGLHLYAFRVSFDRVTLERYPDAPSEPRLRPTTFTKHIAKGSEYGSILVRGRRHMVYRTLFIYDEEGCSSLPVA